MCRPGFFAGHNVNAKDVNGIGKNSVMRASVAAYGPLIVSRKKRRRIPDLYAQKPAKVMNKISRIKGRLRVVHLGTHLISKPLLTAKQLKLYNRLRGYEGGHGGDHGGGSPSDGKNKHMKHQHGGH